MQDGLQTDRGERKLTCIFAIVFVHEQKTTKDNGTSGEETKRITNTRGKGRGEGRGQGRRGGRERRERERQTKTERGGRGERGGGE